MYNVHNEDFIYEMATLLKQTQDQIRTLYNHKICP